MVHLLVRFEGAEEKFAFSQEVISLGRVSSNTIQVKDVKASRNHCEIRRTDAGWKVVDLESSNGTSINGQKVNTHLLQPGDVLAIGAFEVVFEPAEVAAAPVLVTKPAEPIEKTVVEAAPVQTHASQHLHRKAVPAEIAAAPTPEAESERKVISLVVKGSIAAAVLIAGLIAFNSIHGEQVRRGTQEAAYAAAVKSADSGDLADALAKLESFISSTPDADLAKRATAKRDELAGILAKKQSDAAKRAEKDIAELLARQLAAGASSRFEGARAQVQAYLATGDFAAAVDEAKQFLADCPDGDNHDRMASLLKNALGKAADAWEILEAQANELVKAEKYAEATALLADAQDRFNGTRYAYEVTTKVRGIQRLSGVTAAYASGAPEMSAAAQETMLAVTDLVKARQYEAALKAFDKMVNALPEKDRTAFAGRRDDIGREAGIFRKLLAAINNGEMTEFVIELGGTVKGHLSQASDLGVTIEFKDISGKGGTTGRKWAQVPGVEMLTYFRQMKLNGLELLGLAAFCYDNRMPNDGADIVNEIIHAQAPMQADAFGLIARVRAMGVPAEGFVYFERGWYTKTEYLYAKLDYKAKKGAELIGKIDAKLADQGYAIWHEMSADASLEADFKEKAKGYFMTSLHAKRQGIMKGLENSQNIANFRALQELKKELNRRRAAAIAIIYDKEIYPDENHGVVGQPKVDDAVKLVRDMWEKPLTVAARLDDGVRVLVEAGEKTNGWLKEMGEAGDDAAMEEYDLLLGHINEALNLKNVCLNKQEQEIRDYNRKVLDYNKKNTETQMVGVEIECAKITNEYREMMGRKYLEIHPMLGKCAKKHSQEMVDLAYFAHESPTGGMKTPSDRAAKEGYSGGVGENICTGYGDAMAAFQAWYHSSGHHRNMLSDGWNHIGLGNVGGSMWTENLGRGPSQLGGASSSNASSGAGATSRGSSGKNPVRAGVGGPKKRDVSPTDQGGKSAKPEDKSARKESPYKQPDGPCVGTTPYDDGGKGGPAPAGGDKPRDKPADKGDGK